MKGILIKAYQGKPGMVQPNIPGRCQRCHEPVSNLFLCATLRNSAPGCVLQAGPRMTGLVFLTQIYFKVAPSTVFILVSNNEMNSRLKINCA